MPTKVSKTPLTEEKMSQDNDPWGNNPKNADGNDLNALLDKLKNNFFGAGSKKPESESNGSGSRNGGPNLSGKGLTGIIGVAVAAWMSTGIYILPEGFHGVELTFGKYSETAVQPGFNWHMPYLIGSVDKVDIGSLNTLQVGSKNGNNEGQMLTSDENIVEVGLSVQYRIGDAKKYLFSVNDPVNVLRETLISSIREVVGSNTVDYVLTNGRGVWPDEVRANLVKTLEGFNAGFDIARVELSGAKAPKEVQEAFDDAVKAREDAERYKLQARAYANGKIPLARGEAQQILAKALGDKESAIAKATGEANRFGNILKAYQLAPQVTRDRMYIETLQKIYGGVNNIVVDTEGKNAPLLYLSTGQQGAQSKPPVMPQLDTKSSDYIHQNSQDELKMKSPKEQSVRLTR